MKNCLIFTIISIKKTQSIFVLYFSLLLQKPKPESKDQERPNSYETSLVIDDSIAPTPRELDLVLLGHIRIQNPPISIIPLLHFLVKQLVYIHLCHSFLPQRRAGPRSQMLHKVLKIHLGISRISLDLARVSAGTRPPNLDHDHKNILIASDGHGANHRVHHHVEEVPVSNVDDQLSLSLFQSYTG